MRVWREKHKMLWQVLFFRPLAAEGLPQAAAGGGRFAGMNSEMVTFEKMPGQAQPAQNVAGIGGRGIRVDVVDTDQ